MIFETLNEAAERGELILTLGAMCHYHLRKDGQITIREIIVLPKHRRKGKGRALLDMIENRHRGEATSVFATVPADLPANKWYEAMGFVLEGHKDAKSGRKLAKWRKRL